VVTEWSTTLRVAVPAFLYVVQNNVLFVAATELDAPVFQVLYQLKILTTALFTIIILGKSITMVQWGALFLLACGVAVVQLSTSAAASTSADSLVDVSSSSTKGLMAVAAACMLSGFCGVWFEKMLKLTGQSEASLWVRNIQLALVGLPVAALNV
jgi:UDP-sugar transporter A1/2/3